MDFSDHENELIQPIPYDENQQNNQQQRVDDFETKLKNLLFKQKKGEVSKTQFEDWYINNCQYFKYEENGAVTINNAQLINFICQSINPKYRRILDNETTIDPEVLNAVHQVELEREKLKCANDAAMKNLENIQEQWLGYQQDLLTKKQNLEKELDRVQKLGIPPPVGDQ